MERLKDGFKLSSVAKLNSLVGETVILEVVDTKDTPFHIFVTKVDDHVVYTDLWEGSSPDNMLAAEITLINAQLHRAKPDAASLLVTSLLSMFLRSSESVASNVVSFLEELSDMFTNVYLDSVKKNIDESEDKAISDLLEELNIEPNKN